MNAKSSRIAAVILGGFAIVYFGWQISRFLYNPLKTEIASLYQYTHNIELNGVMLKEEQIIDETYDGIIRYEVHNAKKMPDNSVVASVFDSQQALSSYMQAEQIKEKISLLQELNDQKSSDGTEKNKIASVERRLVSVLNGIKSGDFQSAYDEELNFLRVLLQQEKILDHDLRFDDEIAELQNRLSSLEISEGTPIRVPVGGYFTNEIDGFEGKITQDALKNYSVEEVEALIGVTPDQAEAKHIGKVIPTTNWSYVGIVKTKDLESISEKDKITMSFSGKSTMPIQAKVEKIYPDLENEYSTVLLSSKIMNENIINLRKSKASIELSKGTGIKIDRSALRMQEDQTGVFINVKGVARFRKVQIVYRGDDFVISAATADADYIQLYDEIIIEGEGELYDGKPLHS